MLYEKLKEANKAAIDWLFAKQSHEGWWTDELETNVTMTAEHIMLLAFIDLPFDPIREAAIKHILSCQRYDGSWSLYYKGPADLSTTIEAYVALKFLGYDPGSEPMKKALKVIHRMGGLAKARVFTKMWLALFGQYPWEGVPSLPPEMIFLPHWIPFNIYDFACWARQTIAPLLIVLTKKPVKNPPCELRELIAPGTPKKALMTVPGSGIFWWIDRAIKLYNRLPRHPMRETAYQKIVKWIIERQEADGSWGGIQPPWVYSIIALNLQGYSNDHPVIRKALTGLDSFSICDDKGWRLQACESPVWDTAWAILALRRSGIPQNDPHIVKAVEWLINQQILDVKGDWAIKCDSDVKPGGWAFEFENDLYPDIDDTAVVVLSLLAADAHQDHPDRIQRAVDWIIAMRSQNKAWGAFDKDNTNQAVYKIPFADFGAMIDPPTEDVTAHAVEMLARVDPVKYKDIIQPACKYLLSCQDPRGCWFGRWGVNYIYGTWCVVTALLAVDKQAFKEPIERACQWLISHQNPDGGWGETCYTYEDASLAGIGDSTPSQTAWALITLLEAGLTKHPAIEKGLEYLVDSQENGTWNEDFFTGTGFPRDFYINYHMYRHIFPTMALGIAISKIRQD